MKTKREMKLTICAQMNNVWFWLFLMILKIFSLSNFLETMKYLEDIRKCCSSITTKQATINVAPVTLNVQVMLCAQLTLFLILWRFVPAVAKRRDAMTWMLISSVQIVEKGSLTLFTLAHFHSKGELYNNTGRVRDSGG